MSVTALFSTFDGNSITSSVQPYAAPVTVPVKIKTNTSLEGDNIAQVLLGSYVGTTSSSAVITYPAGAFPSAIRPFTRCVNVVDNSIVRTGMISVLDDGTATIGLLGDSGPVAFTSGVNSGYQAFSITYPALV